MSAPYLGEIRMVGFYFAPMGWAFCDGALLSIADNDALFALLGTTYGGDGINTFALPDLRGRIPLHIGTGGGGTYGLGQTGGTEGVTLTVQQMPAHQHIPNGATAGSLNSPTNTVWAGWTGAQFIDQTANGMMNAAAIGSAGGSQPHNNLPPFLAINFVIALAGIFPTQ
jgi:microcystin-dependent protein